MSRVFVAEETALGRTVVIKVLPPETAAQVSLERFKREILLAARLQHAHIVPLHSAGESNGLPYFTMPFVEGESLRIRLARHGELPVNDAIRILREIASALAYAHERGIVHRDIKPDNVLLSGGSAMVTDFGVAKALSASSNAEHGGVTSLGVALGTPAYMSPEQASADPSVDHRADIYSFGVLAYELLTGQPPFAGRTPQNLLAAHVNESPEAIGKRRASLPPALAALVMRCLEKRPADRPQGAAEVVHSLDDITTPSGGMPPTGAQVAATGVAAPSAPPRTSRGQRLGARGVVVGAVAAAFLIGAPAYWLIENRRSEGPSAQDGAMRASGRATDERSIAVLPFTNIGGDSAKDFFADGMADELTTALGKVPRLQVAARSAAFSYRGKQVDPKEVGARLHVSKLLEGSLSRSGNRMRLNVQLINASDGLALWSESYERQVSDVFKVQDEVARAIVGALKLTLGGTQQTLVTAGTGSIEAHDAYLQGLFYLRRHTEPNLREAIALFERAVSKDSGYAAPWAGIATAWYFLADDWLPPRQAIPKSRAAVRRAIAIDSTSAVGHAQLGLNAAAYDWNPAAAELELRRALALDPRQTTAARDLAEIFAQRGESDSALAVLRRAVAADPISADAASNLAHTLIQVNALDSADSWLRRARELDASQGERPRVRAELRIRQGRCADALVELPLSEAGGMAEALRATCEARLLGRASDARARVARLVSARKTQYVAADYIALGYIALGDRDSVFRWLDQAFEDRSGNLKGLGGWLWDPVRFDPRFRALEKRMAQAGPMTP